uniref:CRAL-TRIO domain-containing protein n=1 Tax=Timema monikensis TaxID=170555 RepID=A0A7R9E3L5_9NEOP|nr:unnamed protein product [Timema monikensis]
MAAALTAEQEQHAIALFTALSISRPVSGVILHSSYSKAESVMDVWKTPGRLLGKSATKNFIDVVNRLRRRRAAGPVSWGTAVKFLAARKFDISRAVGLYEQHEATRHREGLVSFDPGVEPLKSELDTGKFTILPTRDATGAAIAVFTARMHCPQVSSHQTTLQGVVYQLDVALESVDTQRSGLVFIYDMSDSKYSSFDYDLSQKILTLLKAGPALTGPATLKCELSLKVNVSTILVAALH